MQDRLQFSLNRRNAQQHKFYSNVIRKLPEVHLGQFHADFHHVQNFLISFGFLKTEGVPLTVNTLDARTMEALKLFQKTYGLKERGIFDKATREIMQVPRCGMPDIVGYQPLGSWRRRELTFAFGVMTRQAVGAEAARQAVRNACATWTREGLISLTEVELDALPDVVVEWRPANDPDHSMVGSILAHADFPPDHEILVPGLPQPVHFDDEEHAWNVGAQFDIESVALHEFGHILGLLHEPAVPTSVMVPFYAGIRRSLSDDDRRGLRELYSPPMVDRDYSLGSTLLSGQILRPGYILTSPNKLFQLWYQADDGNVVLYDGNWKPWWATGTNGRTAGEVRMEANGNFIVNDASGATVWSSGTLNYPGATLHLENNRSLVIYHNGNVIWRQPGAVLPADNWPRPPRIPDNVPSHGDHLNAGEYLRPEQRLISLNRFYKLTYQDSDGNLVLYDSNGKQLWSTGLVGKTAGKAFLKADGNFVLEDAQGVEVWSLGTGGHPGARLYVQSDRNVVLYDKDWNVLWSSNTMGRDRSFTSVSEQKDAQTPTQLLVQNFMFTRLKTRRKEGPDVDVAVSQNDEQKVQKREPEHVRQDEGNNPKQHRAAVKKN